MIGKEVGAAVGEAAGGVLGGLTGLVDALFTSDEERLDKSLALERLRQVLPLAQIALTQQEAQHRSVWVAGWRPGVGWVCLASLAWHLILRDLGNFALAIWWPESPPLPEVREMADVWILLGGMLGLGGMRSLEKIKGVAR